MDWRGSARYYGIRMKFIKIISAVAALCFTLWMMVDARADQAAVQDSGKRYHGWAYGDPRHCAWQACTTDDDCVAIDNDRCVGPVAVNRDSAVSAQEYFESTNLVIDCTRQQSSAPGDVECENKRCRLKVNDRRSLCRQRELSEEVIRRCLANEPELCPEAAYRADVWSLQPGYDAIIRDACDREHARSCFIMGSNHRDAAEATAMLMRACELKFAHSCYVLGRRFVQDDPFNAWFHAACEIDSSFCMKTGKGLKGDKATSTRSIWFKRGCDKGDTSSCAAVESMENALQARQRARERALERNLAINKTARELWDKIVRDNLEEMEGATFLGVERSKPGYALTDYFVIRYSTKEGEIKQIFLPAE